MTRRAVIDFNVAQLRRERKQLRRDVREAKRALDRNRFSNPRGATSGGGGRGGFQGALKDFATRDEIVGRTGTLYRLGAAGNVMGFLLALQSIEELFRNMVNFAKGDQSFGEVIETQLKFLIPSVLRESLPELLIALGISPDREKIDRKAAEDWLAVAENPKRWTIDPDTGKRVRAYERINDDMLGNWHQKAWQSSENFRRLMSEAVNDGVR